MLSRRTDAGILCENPMSRDLNSSRLEAFSDGVIAVIITIMVLDLRVPSARELGNTAALHADLRLILVYLLSFVQVGIYWVNHHYLIDDVEQVSHGILWANLAFLFALSLFPFATNWVGERGISSFSIALYAVVSVLPAITWVALSNIICRQCGIPPAGSRTKQFVSSSLYIAAIPVACYHPFVAIGMIVLVAILWLVPPRRLQGTAKTEVSPTT
jgi:uncharacterized membrane protein